MENRTDLSPEMNLSVIIYSMYLHMRRNESFIIDNPDIYQSVIYAYYHLKINENTEAFEPYKINFFPSIIQNMLENQKFITSYLINGANIIYHYKQYTAELTHRIYIGEIMDLINENDAINYDDMYNIISIKTASMSLILSKLDILKLYFKNEETMYDWLINKLTKNSRNSMIDSHKIIDVIFNINKIGIQIINWIKNPTNNVDINNLNFSEENIYF